MELPSLIGILVVIAAIAVMVFADINETCNDLYHDDVYKREVCIDMKHRGKSTAKIIEHFNDQTKWSNSK